MPKLNDIWIKATAGDGTKFLEKCPLSVTVDGVFTLRCPDALVSTAQTILRTQWAKWPAMEFDCSRGTPKVTGKLLADCTKFLTHCAEEYVKCEVVRTRVIRYSHKADVCFWLMATGKIEPCGAFDHEREGDWWKPSDGQFKQGRDFTHYSFGLAVAVRNRVEYRRSTGTTVKYESVPDEDLDEHGERLNYYGCSPDEFEHELPYSQQAAEFFCKCFSAICEMARRFDAFFGDADQIAKAIETGTAPRLTA